jgi:hypothetical protein
MVTAGETNRDHFSAYIIFPTGPHSNTNLLANRLRYPLVGGTRGRHFDGTNFKPHKVLENAHAAKQQSHHHDPGAFRGDRPGALPGFGLAPPRRGVHYTP